MRPAITMCPCKTATQRHQARASPAQHQLQKPLPVVRKEVEEQSQSEVTSQFIYILTCMSVTPAYCLLVLIIYSKMVTVRLCGLGGGGSLNIISRNFYYCFMDNYLPKKYWVTRDPEVINCQYFTLSFKVLLLWTALKQNTLSSLSHLPQSD